MMPTIRLSRGVLGAEELAAVGDVFADGYFGHSDRTVRFEQALAAYLPAPHVVATNTGTSALHLALATLGMGPGDEVIVPALTFVASFQAIKMTGAIPVPCDVDPETLQMDLRDAERRITSRTKVLMPVHYAGGTCDLDALQALAGRHALRVVEDAAHAFGGTSNGQKIGSRGDLVCFSFDSIKNITCGEGGAIVCRDGVFAERLRIRRKLGIEAVPNMQASRAPADYVVESLGFRYHMSAINAAIGLVQLGKVEEFARRRREICTRYDAALRNLPGVRTLKHDYRQVNPHIYVIRVLKDKRDELMQFLAKSGIQSGINYVPNHRHALFAIPGLQLPETELAYRQILSLPLHCALTDAEVGEVIARVQTFLESDRGQRA